METRDYSLSQNEVELLIRVLDRAQFTRIETAKAVVALAEKLAAPFGGLKPVTQEVPTSPQEDVATPENEAIPENLE